MGRFIWHVYEWFYDAILLRMIPYRSMIKKTYEALDPRKGKCYLDAGCGTGNFLSLLLTSQKGVKAVGVDFSPAMLTRACKKLKNKGEVNLCDMDLNTTLPFKKNNFDGIVCINVLYSLKNPDFVLKELYRVLNNDGKLILSTPHRDPKISAIIKEHTEALKIEYPLLWRFVFLAFLLKVLLPAIAVVSINLFIKTNKGNHFFTEKEIKSLLERNGFLIQSLDLLYGRQNWFVVAKKNSKYDVN